MVTLKYILSPLNQVYFQVKSWLTRVETGSVLDTVEDQPVVKTREILGKSVEHRQGIYFFFKNSPLSFLPPPPPL